MCTRRRLLVLGFFVIACAPLNAVAQSPEEIILRRQERARQEEMEARRRAAGQNR